MSKDIVDKLVSISSEKLVLLNKLLDLSKLQKKFISESDMDNVNIIIDKKDEVMKEIDALDIKFMTHFAELKKENNVVELNELDTSKYPNLKELKNVVKEITSTLMAISLLDEENNKSLKADLEKIKLNLRTVKKGQKAYKGYNKVLDNNIMIDEKK
ncbi:flagellar export chaperone FlgN [Anaerosalibacter sp. Marseille-P3206]|uniref:flagellar export chaperone FlgN n=1 Tax=Anaerosalibacter sp. Marseille-P3206 TaxID=1871005 RepID=UPI0009879233|nr:flagellar export chaperone FlgN [Anaerosalibacter sp. Marseille-P3206]